MALHLHCNSFFFLFLIIGAFLGGIKSLIANGMGGTFLYILTQPVAIPHSIEAPCAQEIILMMRMICYNDYGDADIVIIINTIMD